MNGEIEKPKGGGGLITSLFAWFISCVIGGISLQ